MDVQTYEEWSSLEETHWWFIGRKKIFTVLIDRFLNGRNLHHICDVGCGAGAMIPALSRYGKVWGLESSGIPIDQCLKRGVRNVLMGASENLPFKADSLDALALFDVIEHTDDDDRVLKECWRVCKQRAVLFVSVPAYQFLMSPNDIVAHHKRRYTRRALKKKLHWCGFRTIKGSYYNFFLFPLIFFIIMAIKVLWRVQNSKTPEKAKGNISYKIPGIVNHLLLGVLTLESTIIRKANFPFGHSLVLVAVKE